MRRKPSRRNTRVGIEPLDARLLLSTLVAVVDTGVDLNSSTDAPYYDLSKGYNAYTQQASTADGSNVADNSAGLGNHGHGSTVADSVVMGIRDTTAQPGAAGADVKIMPIRVTSDSGNLDGNSFGAVVRGIFYAAYHHASVINVSIVFLSLSDSSAHVPNNPDPSYTNTAPTFQDAIDYARSKGAVVVTGAGNNHYDLDSTNTDQNGYYPLHIFPTFNTGPNLLVAASTEPSGDLTSISNFGATHVTLGAPAIQNATSYAAGYTTGVTGVIAALNPGLSADGLAGLIKSSARVYPQLQGKLSTGAVISPANAVAASAVGPTVVSSAAAFPETVTGSSTNLAVLGMGPSGESGLTYTWSVINGPPVAFAPASANGTNAGKNITAQFSQPGSYTFQARISTGTGASVTSEVHVNVTSVAASVEVSPSSVPVDAGNTENFLALARDQFGAALATQPQFAWSVKPGGAGGAINESGQYTAPASASGQDIVSATTGPVSGTSVVSVLSVPSTRGPVAIDTGSNVGAGSFVADVDVVGGNTGTTTSPIDASGAANPAPETVYQSERWSGDSFTYTIPGLDSGASYTVRLHFAETFYHAAGSRQFNVTINGALVLDRLDLFEAAGGANRALTKSISARADSSGKLTITFTNVVGGASCCGIEVIPGDPPVVPPSEPIAAVSLGQDGHDVANIRDLVRAVPGPDGLQDVHIRLSNLPEDTLIDRVEINRSGGNGLYRSDGSPWSWSSVVSRATTAPGQYSPSADVYFQPNYNVDDDDHEYQIYIYLAGQTLPVTRFVHVTDDPGLRYTPAVPPPPVAAVSLGQDGSDFANIFDFSRAVPGPDGLQDVHIRLSNLPQNAPIERVVVNRSGGGGLYLSDGSLWGWSTVVARASTAQGVLSDVADVYFQPNPGVVDVDHEYQLQIVFAGLTPPVDLLVHVTDDPLLRKKQASAT